MPGVMDDRSLALPGVNLRLRGFGTSSAGYHLPTSFGSCSFFSR